MPITDISRDWGASPSIVRLTTTDNLATVTAADYLADQIDVIEDINKGTFEWVAGDVIAITYSDGQAFFTRDADGTLVVDVDIPAGSITTAMIQDGAVTYPKIQDVTANTVLGQTGVTGVVQEIPCTAAGRAIIGAANAAAQRVAIGAGTIAVQDANNVALTGGTLGGAITGVTQAPNTNNTTLATTEYADTIAAAGAPIGATYITQTPNGTLTNEQALSLLATGILKSTTGTGVVSIAATGTDYVAPTTTLTVAGTANEITSSAGAQDLSTNRTWTLSLPAALTFTGKTITGGAYASASATNFTFTTGTVGTAVTGVTQSPNTNNTTLATTAYTDSAVAAISLVNSGGLISTYWKIHLELFGSIGNTTLGSATASDTADTVYYLPALVGFPVTITDLGINVSAAGTATSCIISVYAANSTKTAPTGNPIANSTTSAITITGTGVKSATLGTPVTLPAGLYFFALLMNGTCTFVSAGASVACVKFGASTSTGSKVIKYTQSSSYAGGFPTVASLSENTNAHEFIYIRGNS